MQRRLNNQIINSLILLFLIFFWFFDFLKKVNKCHNIFLKSWNVCVLLPKAYNEPKFLWAKRASPPQGLEFLRGPMGPWNSSSIKSQTQTTLLFRIKSLKEETINIISLPRLHDQHVKICVFLSVCVITLNFYIVEEVIDMDEINEASISTAARNWDK